MQSPVSTEAGPDGFGPIDAVVTWVDGSDPAFVARRSEAAERLKREDPELAGRSELRFAPGRYIQHDEIRYCIRSILNHAPWMRRIWLVTDDQFPAAFDREALDPRIVVVSHRELFGEIADALPVFNSEALGVMLWRIKGLSERFVYFNDDILLSKPARPEDFFVADRPVLHGKWTALEPSSPAWLQRRVESARLFGFDGQRFFKEAHTPISLSRSAIGAVHDRYPEMMERNARRRFRAKDGHSIVGLHNHFCLANDRAAIDSHNRWLVFGDYSPQSGEEAIRRSLARIGSGQFFSTCLNAFGSFVEHMPDVYRYLEAGAGPRLSFEIWP